MRYREAVQFVRLNLGHEAEDGATIRWKIIAVAMAKTSSIASAAIMHGHLGRSPAPNNSWLKAIIRHQALTAPQSIR